MKKAALAAKYKFNINRSVGMGTTIRFSLGVVKAIARNALENSGVKNADEIIKRHEATIIRLQKV